MRFATWNVNSLKARLPRVLEWIDIAQPDVLCMQETKLADDAFPLLDFKERGYDAAHFGEDRWNGVATISRVGIENVTTGFGESDDSYAGEARCLSVVANEIRIVNLYVPNGREVGTEFYDRKLEWFKHLASWLDSTTSTSEPLIVAGDMNVAPEDKDVWNPKAFEGATHVTPQEREAFRVLCDWGLSDTVRTMYPDDQIFTYWDYRRGDFHQGRGMRIDHVLVSKPLQDDISWIVVDRNARKGEKPSDHAPIIVDIANH